MQDYSYKELSFLWLTVTHVSDFCFVYFCLHERFYYPLFLTIPILYRGVFSTLSGVLAIPKTGQWRGLPLGPCSGTTYRGPAPAGSRDILRMNSVGKRDESKRREKEAYIPWFTQKANKVLEMGLALFTEASGALLMWWKCRALSQEGLRSPGRKVNSEGLCASGDQPEKRERERERERKREKEWHGETKLWWSQVCSFILKRSFYALSYTYLEVKDTESCRVSSTLHEFDFHQDQDVFCISFHLQGFVLCTLSSGPEAY